MVHLTSLMHIFDRVWTLVSHFVCFTERRNEKREEGGRERWGEVDGKERGGRRRVKEEVGRVAGCKERGKKRVGVEGRRERKRVGRR